MAAQRPKNVVFVISHREAGGGAQVVFCAAQFDVISCYGFPFHFEQNYCQGCDVYTLKVNSVSIFKYSMCNT